VIGASANQLKRLFEPIRIGPKELRNRVICTGHNPHYGSDGTIGDQMIAFHVQKARGGVALSTTGATSVHPSGGMLPLAPLENFDDAVIPGYQRLAEGMHAEGALMMVQLAHASSAIGSHHSGSPMWAASATFGEYGREVPHVMTTAEVEEVLHAFYQAASRVRRSGLDGVELSVFAGTLAQQMLSPVTNSRTDRFGGSAENRLRFLVELVKQTRSALGDDRLLALKIAGDELYEAGLHLREMQDIVRRLDREVAVDYYVVASGTNMDHFARIDHWPPSPAPHGLRVGLASGIKEVTERPVAALARIVDPEMAEELIARGECDLIAIVRAMFADPDWVNKAAAGRLDDIRRCVGASSGCIDRIQLGEEARCIYNPATGREREWGVLPRAAASRKVVVVGGGPGGLEAARVAAERGHQVTLLEAGDQLGGAALDLAKKPGRGELIGIPRWLAGQVVKLGVAVRLGHEATVDDIVALRPDVVVLATGAVDGELPSTQRSGGPTITSAWSVVRSQVSPGQRVVIIDHLGQDLGCAVAELVADAGGTAYVVSRHFHPAIDFGLTNTVSLYRRLFAKEVDLIPHHDLARIDGATVTLVNIYGKKSRAIESVDAVVFAVQPRANDGLLAPLRARGLDVVAIGDCVAPRDIENATVDGQRAARAI
jgi:2,4-dienoyl-CoA reductase-like NADH-dependent reductase (Old Yellow Enzyme family)